MEVPYPSKEKLQNVLEKSADLLEKLGLKYWLDCGTALGAGREAGFLPGEFDIDLGVMMGDMPIGMLLNELEINEYFHVWFLRCGHYKSCELCKLKDNVRIDFNIYQQNPEKGIVWRASFIPNRKVGVQVFPEKLFNELEMVELNGRKYPVPHPVSEFLTLRYGDWASPRKDWDYMKDPPCLKAVHSWDNVNFTEEVGEAVETWPDFYKWVCGSQLFLEGNIMEQMESIKEIAKYVAPGDKVLEIGTGSGVIAAPIAQAGVKVVSVDIEQGILDMAKINAKLLGVDIEYVLGDAFALPFKDQEFKVAFSGGLIEHFSDEDIGRLIAEHQRVSDVVVVVFPLVGADRGSFGNERWLKMKQWEAILKPMGALRGFVFGSEPKACFTFRRNK